MKKFLGFRHSRRLTQTTVSLLLGSSVLGACAWMQKSQAHDVQTVQNNEGKTLTLQAGHPSLQAWRLPERPTDPPDNESTPLRVELGKKLFFDPRLSRDQNMSCATCHSPMMGWSDGLATTKGFQSMVLKRASPTLVNVAFNPIQMWDGRKTTLENQAMGGLENRTVMNTDLPAMFSWLNSQPTYRKLFDQAYPNSGPIDAALISKAFASFERTIVSNTSPFDQWIAGKKNAMSADQIKGFALFVDPQKTNCASCHSGANFTDNGFHNIGLASFGKDDPDVGRFAQRAVASLKGAFKTPTLRESARSAPYFHDGSAKTLDEVVAFYAKGGEVKTNLSPEIKPLNLTGEEQKQLVSFLQALSSPQKPFVLPELPLD
jgi:cytochrome c peroxidase